MAKPGPGFQFSTNHPLAQGMVGCWLFNEGSGDTVFDLSGNGNHAQRSSTGAPSVADVFWVNDEPDHGPGWHTVDGATRHALLVPADDAYKTGNISIVVGYKILDEGPSDFDILVHCSNGDTWTQGYRLYSRPVSAEATPHWSTGTLNTAAVAADSTEGVFHQIACVFDAANSNRPTVYVDNNAGDAGVDAASPFPIVYTSVGALGFGRQDHATRRDWEGTFYYIFIYNRQLSESEITDLYEDPYQTFSNRPMSPGIKDALDLRVSPVLTLFEVDLPTGTRKWTWADVSGVSPTRGFYEPRILSTEVTLRRGIQDLGEYVRNPSLTLNRVNITVNDTDRDLAKEFSGARGNEVENSPARIGIVGSVLVGEADWWTPFVGRLAAFEKATENSWDIEFRNDDLPLTKPVPKRVLTRSMFPNLPGENINLTLPFCYGIHDSTGRGSGFIPGILVDNVNHRYALSLGWLKTIRRAYADGAVVNTSDWTAKQDLSLTKGVQIQLVEFTADQEGKEITFDVEGYEDVGDGTGAVILNRMRQLEHLLDNFVYSDYQAGNWVTPGTVAPIEPVSLETTVSFFDKYRNEGSRYIATRQTGISILNDWLRSNPLIVATWTQDNEMAFIPLDHAIIPTAIDFFRIDQDRRTNRFNYRLGTENMVRSVIASYLLDSAQGNLTDTIEAREPAVTVETQELVDVTWSAARLL